MARSHTKKGPGRSHGQCQLKTHPATGEHLGVRTPVQRFAAANFGGNWKGTEYLSYREHDMVTRLTDARWTMNPMRRTEAFKHVESLRS